MAKKPIENACYGRLVAGYLLMLRTNTYYLLCLSIGRAFHWPLTRDERMALQPSIRNLHLQKCYLSVRPLRTGAV